MRSIGIPPAHVRKIFGAGEIQAWTAACITGYTWTAGPWRPRLGLSTNIASGDRDATDRDLETFKPLFPRGNYFSETALLGPRNFFNIQPSLTLTPLAQVSVTVDMNWFWRLETADGLYSLRRFPEKVIPCAMQRLVSHTCVGSGCVFGLRRP